MVGEELNCGSKGQDGGHFGRADQSSIAWAIAERMLQNGATVVIGYQQKFFSRVRLLLQENAGVEGARCDILNEAELTEFFQRFEHRPIDILVHGIAYGPAEVFTDPPSQIKSDAFSQTLEISTHSLMKVVGYAKPYMREWGSVMTLTYQASEQASPFYGLMGVAKAALESAVRYLAIELGQSNVRINAISPGPIETPAALGEMLAFLRNPSALDTPAGAVLRGAMQRLQADPLLSKEDDQVKAKALWHAVQTRISQECAIQSFITQDDVGDCALFLASDLSRKMTGQLLRIDGGMSTSRLTPAGDGPVTMALPTSASAPGANQPPVKATPRPVVTSVRAPSGGGNGVVAYLEREFPFCQVADIVGSVGLRIFMADGPGLSATLCVGEDVLALGEDEVLLRLRRWGTSGMLREAGRAPLVATAEGLQFARLGSEPEGRWTAEVLASPDYVPETPIEIHFADQAKCAAFRSACQPLLEEGVRVRVHGDQAVVLQSPRRHLLGLVARAGAEFGAQVTAPEGVRPIVA